MSFGVEHRRLIAMRITCPCRKSVVLPSLLAISLSLTGVQATGWENTDVGTNGAGDLTWTPSRAGVPPFGAEFCQVVDGCVTLFVPIHVSVSGQAWVAFRYGQEKGLLSALLLFRFGPSLD